jgi:plasmid stability protein
MVQIRDVPDPVVDVLKSRAAARGLSLSEFLRNEVTAIAQRPVIEDLMAEFAARPRRQIEGVTGADLVRAGRTDNWPDDVSTPT